MKTLIEHFDLLYPKYSSAAFRNCCVVKEKENAKENAFLELKINGIDGYEIPNMVVKDVTSFYAKPLIGIMNLTIFNMIWQKQMKLFFLDIH